jgi:threonine dehydrogenase-like Zn-dependent dehydrogenase
MRALVFDGTQLRLEPRYADPKPVPGEALIRPLRMGICATDLEICHGYMNYTGVLGHEFVGVVEQINSHDDATRKKILGQRVVGSINAVCGECDMCKVGLATHCRKRTVLGIAGRDGCFADRLTLPLANLIPVPDAIDDDTAGFAEPLAAALHARDQLHIEGRPYITILGDGRLGLLCAQVFAPLNASVRLVGKHPEKMNLCEKWGIRHRHVNDVGRRADQDVVVDCTGSPDGIALAMLLVRPRGKVLLKTTVAPASSMENPVDLSPVVINEIEIIGSRCGNIAKAVSVLAKKSVDVLSLVSRRFKLDDGIKAMQTAASPDSIKVLLEP